VLVPTGDVFTERQVDEVESARRAAEVDSGFVFSVYVGRLGTDTRESAVHLHAALGDVAPNAVLVAVDPGLRQLEIVTGPQARRYLDDRGCALGAFSMTSSFAAGDLAGGLVAGLVTLGEHGRHPAVLHVDEP
jgi:Domain of unknown function (DUF5130)